jgi:cysteinyl-tRNA synthetase
LDFSDQALQEARQALEGFYGLFNRLRENEQNSTADQDLSAALVHAEEAFKKAMDNDLNTPMAVAELQKLRNEINKLIDRGLSTEARQRALRQFRRLGDVLRLFQLEKWDYGILPATGQLVLTGQEIEARLSERIEARKRKDFAKADEIRKSLAAQGIIIEDKPDGTSRWKR